MRKAVADSPPLALALVLGAILAIVAATNAGDSAQLALGASGAALMGAYAALRDRLA